MTAGSLQSWLLLAQHSRWRHLGDRFGGTNAGVDTTDIVLLLAAIAVAVIGVFVLKHYAPDNDRRGKYNDPRQLFRELCRTHDLRRADRRLLARLATWRGLADPAMVFVTPECFETSALPPELAGAAHEVAQLRVQLFQTV